MNRHILPLVILYALLALGLARTPTKPPLVLISIDGMRPDYVLEADRYGLKIPELRRLLKEGAHASAVTGVLPTVTYPSHTTLVTGVSPAKHGIQANASFDPLDRNDDGWAWYAEDIRVPTLWDVAAQAGLVTSNVDWPVTVGARIDFNIAQIWRASTPDDAKLSRALSTKGLLAEAEKALGPYPSGYAYRVGDDEKKAAFSVYLLEKNKPRLHLCYFSGLDEESHESGPGSPEALAVLEKLDAVIGRLRAAAERAGGGRAIVVVVSDHGFVRTDHELHVNEALREEGLLLLDQKGQITDWRACAWYAGGTAAIMLKDPADEDARRRCATVVKRLGDDPASGVDRVLTGDEARAAGGFPDALFVIGVKPGYRIGDDLTGPVKRRALPRGTHGLLPENHDMDAAFFIAGPGIASGRDLGRIDMRDIAPTLASLLGLPLPTAEGRNLFASR